MRPRTEAEAAFIDFIQAIGLQICGKQLVVKASPDMRQTANLLTALSAKLTNQNFQFQMKFIKHLAKRDVSFLYNLQTSLDTNV